MWLVARGVKGSFHVLQATRYTRPEGAYGNPEHPRPDERGGVQHRQPGRVDRVVGAAARAGGRGDNHGSAERLRDLDSVGADSAAAAVEQLPPSSRRAVRVAHRLFAELSGRLRETPVERLRHERVRVPGPRKAAIVLDSVVRGRR